MISTNYNLININLIEASENASIYKVYDFKTEKYYRLKVLIKGEY
jgi:hypothetical protein